MSQALERVPKCLPLFFTELPNPQLFRSVSTNRAAPERAKDAESHASPGKVGVYHLEYHENHGWPDWASDNPWPSRASGLQSKSRKFLNSDFPRSFIRIVR